MSLRIRQIKPAFWSDAKLLRLPADVRLFYIGTWCIADDAGWFVWDPEQVAIDLHLRPAAVERAMHELTASGRIVLHECGHGEVVHLVDHQRLSAPTKRVESVYRVHLSRCPTSFPRQSTDPRDIPHTPDTVRNGKERNGTVREPATGGLRELVKVDPETGGFVYVAPEAKA